MKQCRFLIALATVAIFFFGCSKDQFGLVADWGEEAVNEEASFILAESGFQVTEIEPLSDIEEDYYTSGILQYTKDGNINAVVDFGAGTGLEKAKLLKDGKEYEIDLKKEDDKDKFFKKIVVPLVKAEDCGYEIVSGMIKFYDSETKMWVATVDFGDGACDNTAMKVTMDGISTFAVSAYF